MKALQHLQAMDFQDKVRKYSSLPAHTIPRTTFRDTTANELTKAVVRFLQLSGHMAWRQGSEGRYRPGKQYTDVLGHRKQMRGNYLPGQNNGASDVGSLICGKFYAWEIKMKDKQSVAQKIYQKEIESSGGVYHIVHSFEEFIKHYNSI